MNYITNLKQSYLYASVAVMDPESNQSPLIIGAVKGDSRSIHKWFMSKNPESRIELKQNQMIWIANFDCT